jgi:gliding motility-associated-like protein
VVCLPEGRATFTNRTTVAGTGGTPIAYSWNFGIAGGTSSLTDPTYFYNSAGPFTIKLTATSARGCADSVSKTLTNIVPQALANWSVNPGEVCIGDAFQFNDISNPLGNTITNWFWDLGDSTKRTTQNVTYTYDDAGTYPVSFYYRTNTGCFSDTVIRPVTVHPYPVVNAGTDLFVLQGGEVVIRAAATGSSNYIYRWTPATWLSSDTALQPITRPQDDITYILRVTGEGGCEDNDDVFVKLLLKPVIPNAFSPNGDGINDTWIIRYLDSYPGATVQVFDRYGRAVLTSKGYNTAWDGNITGKPLPAGVYYYIVDPKNGIAPLTGSVTIIR